MARRWEELVDRRATYVCMIIAAGTAVLVLTYAPGLLWRACAWSILAIVGLVLVVLAVDVLYAILSLERGYPRAALAQSWNFSDDDSTQRGIAGIQDNQHSRPPVGRSAMGRVSTIASGAPSAPRLMVGANHTFRFEDLMADLGAAEYLLCKVQASTALPDIAGARREECDQAIARIRRLLDEITFQNGEHRLVS